MITNTISSPLTLGESDCTVHTHLVLTALKGGSLVTPASFSSWRNDPLQDRGPKVIYPQLDGRKTAPGATFGFAASSAHLRKCLSSLPRPDLDRRDEGERCPFAGTDTVLGRNGRQSQWTSGYVRLLYFVFF